jgi:hypothetical protein
VTSDLKAIDPKVSTLMIPTLKDFRFNLKNLMYCLLLQIFIFSRFQSTDNDSETQWAKGGDILKILWAKWAQNEGTY